MLKGRLVVSLGLLVVLALGWTGSAQALPGGVTFEAAAGIWSQQPSGTGTWSGVEVDVKDDLGLGSKIGFEGWIRLEHPLPFLPDFKFQYTPINLSGDGVISQSFTWQNHLFIVSTPVESDLRLNMADLTAYWHVPMLRDATNGSVDLTWGLTARLVSSKLAVKDTIFSVEISDSYSGVLPLLYAGVRIHPINYLAFLAEVRGIGYSGNSTIDGLVELQVFPYLKNVFLGLGYRIATLKTEDMGDFDLDVKMQGWFLEVGVRF